MLNLHEAVQNNHNDTSGFVSAVNEQTKRRPLGYVRSLINGQILLRTLIDSGNLADNIIDYDVVRSLGLNITRRSFTLGGAANSASLDIIGEIKDLEINFENVKRKIKISCLVSTNTSHSLNLGYRFLADNSAKLKFSRNKASLYLYGIQIELKPSNFNLTSNSFDEIFASISKNIENGDSFKFIDLKNRKGKQSSKLINVDDTISSVGRVSVTKELPPGEISVVPLSFNHCVDGVFYLSPVDSRCEYLSNENLFVMDGVYEIKDKTLNVNIFNVGSSTRSLKKGTKLCKVSPTQESDFEAVNSLNHKPTVDLSNIDIADRRKYIYDSLELDKNSLLDKDQKTKLVDIFIDNFDAVSIGGSDFGTTDLIQFHIKLKPGSLPHQSRVRPLNPHQSSDLRRQLDEWLNAGIIAPCTGPWSSALVPATKKNSDTLRWCIDYRALNAMTIVDTYPLPHLATNLEKLSGGKIFSSLDSAGAYHAIPVHPKSQPYTAFVSEYGVFKFLKLPFGLRNAPSCYCRLVAIALQKLGPGYVIAYLDDILIYSKTINDHFSHVKSVLELHKSVGLKLNIKKCQIFRKEVNYLGHLVCEQGIKMIPEYVEKIQQWPIPTTGAELRSLLGFLNYYRDFIKDITVLTADLNKIRNQNGPIKLNDNQIKNIKTLKEKFLTAPIRAYPNFAIDSPFILETDWSTIGIGALLKQNQDGKERLIACISRSCNKSEANYPSWKGETLAVVWAIKKFYHILSYKSFEIRTDSSFQLFLKSTKQATGIIFRWLQFLQGLNFEVIYVKGDKNPADPVSRIKWTAQADNEEDILVAHVKSQDNDVLKLNKTKLPRVPMRYHYLQLTDPALMQVREILRVDDLQKRKDRIKQLTQNANKWIGQLSKFSIIDNVLYIVDDKNRFRFCAPRVLIPEILAQAHLGHIGTVETLNRLMTTYFWPQMSMNANDYVQSCTTCVHKYNFKHSKINFKHKEVIGTPGVRIYLDLVGPLPPVKYRGIIVQYVLTIMDHMSRYVCTVPMKSLTAHETTSCFVEHYVLKYGLPRTIHTDRGTQFTSELFKQLCDIFGIQNTTTIGFNPTGNSYLERSHGTIKSFLRSMKGDWVKLLPVKTFFYNVTVNKSTGFSPFELFFGRIAVTSVQFLDNLNTSSKSYFSYLHDLQLNIENSLQEAIKRQLDVRFDLDQTTCRKLENFEPGKFVYYLDPRSSIRTLDSRWTGPHLIIRKLNPFTRELQHRKTNNFFLAHVNRLKVNVDRNSLLNKFLETPESTLDRGEIDRNHEIKSFPGPDVSSDFSLSSNDENDENDEIDINDYSQDPEELSRSSDTDLPDLQNGLDIDDQTQSETESNDDSNVSMNSEDNRPPRREAFNDANARIVDQYLNKKV